MCGGLRPAVRARSGRCGWPSAGKVQTPPLTQTPPSRFVQARSSCSPLAGSVRCTIRRYVVAAGGPTMVPPLRRPPLVYGHLLAELGLPGVPDRDVRQPGEQVVVDVGDEPALLVVEDVVDAGVDRQLGLDRPVAVLARRVAQQEAGVVAAAR